MSVELVSEVIESVPEVNQEVAMKNSEKSDAKSSEDSKVEETSDLDNEEEEEEEDDEEEDDFGSDYYQDCEELDRSFISSSNNNNNNNDKDGFQVPLLEELTEVAAKKASKTFRNECNEDTKPDPIDKTTIDNQNSISNSKTTVPIDKKTSCSVETLADNPKTSVINVPDELRKIYSPSIEKVPISSTNFCPYVDSKDCPLDLFKFETKVVPSTSKDKIESKSEDESVVINPIGPPKTSPTGTTHKKPNVKTRRSNPFEITKFELPIINVIDNQLPSTNQTEQQQSRNPRKQANNNLHNTSLPINLRGIGEVNQRKRRMSYELMSELAENFCFGALENAAFFVAFDAIVKRRRRMAYTWSFNPRVGATAVMAPSVSELFQHYDKIRRAEEIQRNFIY